MWLSLSSQGELPTLGQVQSSNLYHDLAPYIAITEGQTGADIRHSIFSAAGAKVVELYGKDITTLRLDQVFSDSSQTMAEETSPVLLNEGKPVHISVAGSEVISNDIEVIQVPLQHNDAAMYLTMVVYDFQSVFSVRLNRHWFTSLFCIDSPNKRSYTPPHVGGNKTSTGSHRSRRCCWLLASDRYG